MAIAKIESAKHEGFCDGCELPALGYDLTFAKTTTRGAVKGFYCLECMDKRLEVRAETNGVHREASSK